ncbi:MAG TPA: double-strand break repair helicase AddA [Caulobacteraceae bacterium]
MSRPAVSPERLASDPKASAFVAANAGSGKTSTLVDRVARLLLAGAAPQTILCVTFTRAAAAEMQRRLFEKLGAWAVMDDPALHAVLVTLEEAERDLASARALFAQALDTPGGLKIQTIHAFCEKVLRRFPLEAGVSPGFAVLDDAAAAQISRRARAAVAEAVLAAPKGRLAQAYEFFCLELEFSKFEDLWKTLIAERRALSAYMAQCAASGPGIEQAIWRACGFDCPSTVAAVEAEALQRCRAAHWRRAMAGIRDAKVRDAMREAADEGDFAAYSSVFMTRAGEARSRAPAGAPHVPAWFALEQQHCLTALERRAAARMAEGTVHAMVLGHAFGSLYEAEKAAHGGLDFGDQISLCQRLLARGEDAAWVLYKLDGGLAHVLVDEAQDTSPEQWDIVRRLSADFFHGEGANRAIRTVFAVGDPKQSIFGFQGSAPQQMAQEEEHFAVAARNAKARFHRAPLIRSWRSRPEILEVVDRVYSNPELRDGLAAASANVAAAPPRHVAVRQAGGCVDLWPLAEGVGAETSEDPWAPVDVERGLTADRILAERIAAEVKAMVAQGACVGVAGDDAERPCRYGDVLVLFRRRGRLFAETIRAFRRRGVPVAGADRFKLAEHGVFADLMAFGRFIQFPADDLALAEVLRGPLCDVNEEGLFDLAHGRQANLWTELARRAGERPEWAAAAALLEWAMAQARARAPFDLYGRLLMRLDDAGRSMRQRILTRLGHEAEQALDAFTDQTLAAESSGVVTLEGVLAWMESLNVEIKREQTQGGGDEVRVMTIHGAKGLEAPIVFLPDTSMKPQRQGGRLIKTDAGAFLWAPKGYPSPVSSAATAELDLALKHETARLLYVAMTRARDRLIICGAASRQAWRTRGSWYEAVAAAFDTFETRTIPVDGLGDGRRFGADPRIAARSTQPPMSEIPLPPWSRRVADAETGGERLAFPSREESEIIDQGLSPLAAIQGLGRLRRGALIHRLLQILPELDVSARPAAARRLLAGEPGLSPEHRDEMIASALGVLADPNFAAVFGPGSRAEVAIVGGAPALPANMVVSGRVDRLLVEPDRIQVVDFKTHRPAPADIGGLDPAHVRQMALYAAVLGQVYPGRRIETALLWTEGPRLMRLPPRLLDDALGAPIA